MSATSRTGGPLGRRFAASVVGLAAAGLVAACGGGTSVGATPAGPPTGSLGGSGPLPVGTDGPVDKICQGKSPFTLTSGGAYVYIGQKCGVAVNKLHLAIDGDQADPTCVVGIRTSTRSNQTDGAATVTFPDGTEVSMSLFNTDSGHLAGYATIPESVKTVDDGTVQYTVSAGGNKTIGKGAVTIVEGGHGHGLPDSSIEIGGSRECVPLGR